MSNVLRVSALTCHSCRSPINTGERCVFVEAYVAVCRPGLIQPEQELCAQAYCEWCSILREFHAITVPEPF